MSRPSRGGRGPRGWRRPDGTPARVLIVDDEFGPELLLADWMLRCEMHGIEVGEVLRERWPELRILLTTGLPTADLEAEAARVGIDGVVEKPFGLEDPTGAIEAALASQRPLPASA